MSWAWALALLLSNTLDLFVHINYLLHLSIQTCTHSSHLYIWIALYFYVCKNVCTVGTYVNDSCINIQINNLKLFVVSLLYHEPWKNYPRIITYICNMLYESELVARANSVPKTVEYNLLFKGTDLKLTIYEKMMHMQILNYFSIIFKL